MARRGWASLSVVLAVGCGAQRSPDPAPATLPPSAVAACAGDAFFPGTIASVAARDGLSKHVAVERLADEARIARAADRAGLASTDAFRVAERSLLARRVLLGLKGEAEAPPISPEELARVRRDHWTELDRPEAVRVIHAVAIATEKDGKKRETAKLRASQIADAVKGAASEAEFRTRAEGVARDGVEVKIETLEPVALDGRIVSAEGVGTYDPAFSAAAHSLTAPHAISPLVATPFGIHVLFLLERTAPVHVSDANLRDAAKGEITAHRVAAAMKALTADVRARTPIAIERNVDEVFDAYFAKEQPR